MYVLCAGVAADLLPTVSPSSDELANKVPTVNPSSDESANKVEVILAQVHDDFRKSLHLLEILPSLNKRSLLTPNEMETLQGITSMYTNQQKVDKLLVEILPRKGMNVLTQLVECLHESKPGTGSAHVELAEKLEGAVTTCVAIIIIHVLYEANYKQ